MPNQDWTPPEVVYGRREVIAMIEELLQHPQVLIDAVCNEHTDFGADELFDLAKPAVHSIEQVQYLHLNEVKEAKRKAVREVLEKVKDEFLSKSKEEIISENQDFSAYDYAGGNFDDAFYQGWDDGMVRASRDVVVIIDQLLSKYQEPTEVQDDPPT